MTDLINHPPHYDSGRGLEVIDIIEAFELDFHAGAVIKYVLRAGKKGSKLEDLLKARWYIERMIKREQCRDQTTSPSPSSSTPSCELDSKPS